MVEWKIFDQLFIISQPEVSKNLEIQTDLNKINYKTLIEHCMLKLQLDKKGLNNVFQGTVMSNATSESVRIILKSN